MFSDRRMILGALVVLIGLLVFAIAGPLSTTRNAGYEHEDHDVYEHEEDYDHERHEREHQHARHAHDADYDYVQVIEKTFKARPGQTLWLDTDFGKVTVRGDEGDEVVLTVTKGVDDVSESKAEELFDDFEIDFDQDAEGITVEGDFEGETSGRRRSPLHVAYEITVPHAFNVQVKTAGGSIAAAHLQGNAELRTAGGSVSATDIDGPVLVKTSGGSINAEAIGGAAELHTSGGSINVEHARGNVEANTSGGSIRLKEIFGTANAHTSGGSITAELAQAPDGPMTLKTSGGSVTLHLNEDARVDIDAQASGGSVRTDLDVEVQGELSKTHVEGTINGGGPLMTLRSSGGSVKILKR